MHFMTEDCNISSNKENFAVVVPITSAKLKITVSKAMFSIIYCKIVGQYLRRMSA